MRNRRANTAHWGCCLLLLVGMAPLPWHPGVLMTVRNAPTATDDVAFASVDLTEDSDDSDLITVPLAQCGDDAASETVREPRAAYHARRVCRVTAYSDRGVTASGVNSGVGQCAAPADIPFGSRVYIPKLGRTFVVTDRTAKRFRHNTVDLFMPTDWRCRQFGRRYMECEFIIYPPAGPTGLAIARASQ